MKWTIAANRGSVTGGKSKQQQQQQLNEINASFIEMKFTMKRGEKSRKNDKRKVEKWDKIEIRLGVKGNSVCEPLKRRESNLPKILVLVSSSGHYSKVSASCLPSIRKQQQQQS